MVNSSSVLKPDPCRAKDEGTRGRYQLRAAISWACGAQSKHVEIRHGEDDRPRSPLGPERAKDDSAKRAGWPPSEAGEPPR